MITVHEEMDYEDIQEMSWCCDEVFEEIEKQEREDEFMELIEETFPNGVDKTSLNDFIRFDVWDIMRL